MKLQIFVLFVLILFFSQSSFAQSKPGWLVNLENTIEQKEKFWKVSDRLERFEIGSFDYNLTLKSGRYPLAIHIMRLNNLPNEAETFAGLETSFSNITGNKALKTKLESFGDEAFLWKGQSAKWAMVQFRKGDVFVDIFTASEITAKRFAHYVLEQIPKN